MYKLQALVTGFSGQVKFALSPHQGWIFNPGNPDEYSVNE
jgi:hypothetical protein